jgi:transglutaminase-like putative cysteine protease
MRIRTGYEISYWCPAPTPMLLMLSVRPERAADLESPDTIHTDPAVPVRSYIDGFGNICSRIVAPQGRITLSSAFVVRDSGAWDAVHPEAQQHPVDELPEDVIVFLLGSRYCETDQMSQLAWNQFGHTEPGWSRVQAIVDYAHKHITFDYQRARPTKTAWQAHEEKYGVCRDYAHLAITLCRCMNIPARYCTGYMGDIRIEPIPGPMDFSAWMEVYLGGAWHTFDARNNRPRCGRVLMGIGRDATDVAISTNFGPVDLVSFNVVSEEIIEEAKQAG